MEVVDKKDQSRRWELLPHGAKSIGMPREEAVRHDHVRARQIEAGGRRLVRSPTDNPDRSLGTKLRHDPPVVHVAPGLQGVDVGDEKTDGHGRRRVNSGTRAESFSTVGKRLTFPAEAPVIENGFGRCPMPSG
ncbi:MAG: hypothetical protein BRD42_09400 [Bacteroidetes bacterium QS_3_64_15]|nr:MAG: hypothetical protein BRD42_09400 [Bacteroidetes bacterium QS_3_64_15]